MLSWGNKNKCSESSTLRILSNEVQKFRQFDELGIEVTFDSCCDKQFDGVVALNLLRCGSITEIVYFFLLVNSNFNGVEVFGIQSIRCSLGGLGNIRGRVERDL